MLFNSASYAIFLPVVFILYWFATRKNVRVQNCLLLVASYYFYSCWDYRFLLLLFFSTLLDFYTGLKINNTEEKKRKKVWLWISIFINVGFLAIFKYFNFFTTSFSELISSTGLHVDPILLNVILPVGISFYTFHGLSYVIDIYYGRINSEKDFIVYSLFVSYFPLLVAGPIERATHLLPQLKKERIFDYYKAIDGIKQISWGLFKKVVIADNCATVVNSVYGNSSSASGSALMIASILFAFQIYCDFSGYSDIALGSSRLLGIELLKNFAFPYFSRDIAEFWRRWHISLSSWFKDYVYIPLGGSKGSLWLKIRNTFIIFLLSGFWHGANWTFIIWGALNAIFFLPFLALNRNRKNLEIVGSSSPVTLMELVQIVITFSMTVFAWIFFRSENVSQAFEIIGRIFSRSLFATPIQIDYSLLFLICGFFTIEWLGRTGDYAIQRLRLPPNPIIRWALFYTLVLSIYLFGNFQSDLEFIYFQF